MRHAKASARAGSVADVRKPGEQGRRELTRDQYDVLRRSPAELPFTGLYVGY